MYVLWVGCRFELAQVLPRVALALQKAGSSAPLGVTRLQNHLLFTKTPTPCRAVASFAFCHALPLRPNLNDQCRLLLASLQPCVFVFAFFHTVHGAMKYCMVVATCACSAPPNRNKYCSTYRCSAYLGCEPFHPFSSSHKCNSDTPSPLSLIQFHFAFLSSTSHSKPANLLRI